MNARILVMGCWLLLFGSAMAAQSAQANTLLIVGDSLSDAYNMPREAGWAALLSERLGGDYTVVNASISGETSAGGVRRLPGLIEQYSPNWLLIILGGNDGLRALNPAQLASNLEEMIVKAREAGIDVALMQIRLPANLGAAYLDRFEGLYPELAARHEALLLPFFLENLFDRPGMMMSDGIHPGEAAQPYMLEAIWPEVKQWLEANGPGE
ncbi:MAG: arylesterase [Wenzhouxiangella sp.]|nr:MAG: arylesterase [Wenzhouxiangella sp.]